MWPIVGDVHFVALDTHVMGAAQRERLEADLKQNELPWTVVYSAVIARPGVQG